MKITDVQLDQEALDDIKKSVTAEIDKEIIADLKKLPEYVIVFAQSQPINPLGQNFDIPILVVEKDKPDWQIGRYNFPGGRIEKGECPEQTALRELREEAGKIGKSLPTLMGVIQGSWGKVHCLKMMVDSNIPLAPQESETQKIFWKNWSEIKDDPRLIPNLRVIIPMMVMGCTGWNIYDEGPSWGNKTHVIDIEIKNEWPLVEKE